MSAKKIDKCGRCAGLYFDQDDLELADYKDAGISVSDNLIAN